jgi:mannose-6-phosphate isomerase-like protein (cupin superfamily)
MPAARIDLHATLDSLAGVWSPLTVATVNDYDVRVVHMSGEFTRHSHPETDEFFLVLAGRVTIRMDAGDVTLGPGEVCVVPKGVAHQPYAPDGADALLFEPSTTVNTGDTPSELTAERRVV